MRAIRPFLLGVFIVVSVTSLGCMHVPFSIPEVNTIPPVDFGSDSTDVHIFRVDIAQEVTMKDGAEVTAPAPKAVETLELSELQPSSPGTTPRQMALSCESGWRYVGFWNYNTECRSHGVAVRLYRPGYETIALTCGQVPSEVHWTEAPDLAAQEKAVDALLGVSLLDPTESTSTTFSVTHRLERGPKSPAHRDALLFAVREYKRLANQLRVGDAEGQELRTELLEKAKRLKALADGKSPNRS